MTCLLNLEVMHSLKGYVPVTYSTRLTFIHTKPVLATIIPAKKNHPSELQSVSPNPCSAADGHSLLLPSQPRYGAVTPLHQPAAH